MLPLSRHRRRLTSAWALILALTVAGWSVEAAAPAGAAARSGPGRASGDAGAHPSAATVSARFAAASRVPLHEPRGANPLAIGRAAASALAAGAIAGVHVHDDARRAASEPAGTGLSEGSAIVASYSGRNRFWIPSLGMNYRVYLFECTRKRDPDNYMYRWGCAGDNNVYILGHAKSVMRPLYDLFNAGGLEVGMVAIYADGDGHIRAYRVTEWRVVNPVDSHWAITHQPVPSMTLQTCVGPDGRDRLNVRLVAID